MSRTLAVIPTYQEAGNIETFLRRLRAASPDVDVLVVDDGSPDGTAAVAERVGEELRGVEVLRRPGKAGLGSAYREGFSIGFARGYEVMVQMDADLSHDPGALPQLLASLEAGADLVIGSRYVPGGSIPHWPVHRRALSRYANRWATFALRMPVADATSGYRVYRAEVLRAIQPQTTKATGYSFLVELARRVVHAGGTVAEVPITFTDRVRGSSKMSVWVVAEAMVLVTWWGLRDRVLAARPGEVVVPAQVPSGQQRV